MSEFAARAFKRRLIKPSSSLVASHLGAKCVSVWMCVGCVNVCSVKRRLIRPTPLLVDATWGECVFVCVCVFVCLCVCVLYALTRDALLGHCRC